MACVNDGKTQLIITVEQKVSQEISFLLYYIEEYKSEKN